MGLLAKAKGGLQALPRVRESLVAAGPAVVAREALALPVRPGKADGTGSMSAILRVTCAAQRTTSGRPLGEGHPPRVG